MTIEFEGKVTRIERVQFISVFAPKEDQARDAEVTIEAQPFVKLQMRVLPADAPPFGKTVKITLEWS